MKQLLLAWLAALLLAAPVSAQVVGALQTITVVDSGTACVTAPTACATFALDSQTGGLALSVSGTWTGTLTFEGTANGSTWTSLLATNLATGAQATTTTASGLFSITNAGVIGIRARATAAVTGAALISAAKGIGFARSAVPAGATALFGDGTSGAPSIAFNSETTLGFWRSAPATVTLQGSLTTTGEIKAGATQAIYWNGRAVLASPADGLVTVTNNAATLGSRLKADALPTVGSGFGTSPSITAGSTALAGSVNVGTGGAATSGVITFGGTAFPAAPFCVLTPSLTNVPTRPTTVSTTQLTLTTSTAWTASDVVSWICISAK